MGQPGDQPTASQLSGQPNQQHQRETHRQQTKQLGVAPDDTLVDRPLHLQRGNDQRGLQDQGQYHHQSDSAGNPLSVLPQMAELEPWPRVARDEVVTGSETDHHTRHVSRRLRPRKPATPDRRIVDDDAAALHGDEYHKVIEIPVQNGRTF